MSMRVHHVALTQDALEAAVHYLPESAVTKEALMRAKLLPQLDQLLHGAPPAAVLDCPACPKRVAEGG